MIKRFLIFFVILFCFFGCSNNSDNENTDIQTFYKIEYNQGSIIGNKTSYPGDFLKVYEYHCVDEGDLFYRIQNMNTYFSQHQNTMQMKTYYYQWSKINQNTLM